MAGLLRYICQLTVSLLTNRTRKMGHMKTVADIVRALDATENAYTETAALLREYAQTRDQSALERAKQKVIAWREQKATLKQVEYPQS